MSLILSVLARKPVEYCGFARFRRQYNDTRVATTVTIIKILYYKTFWQSEPVIVKTIPSWIFICFKLH